MVKLIDESKARKTGNKRSIKEDYGDWEIIAKFKSKPFCIGDIDSVEDDLIDLMNTDEVAFKQIVDYLKSEGYSFGGEDFDADDYADWFTRELYDLFSIYNESELKFGYFDFNVKNLSNYYDESIKRNSRRSIKEDLDWDSDQARCLRSVNSYKKYCTRIIDLASKLEPMYDEIENYLTYTPLNDYYLDRIGKVLADTLDTWSKIDRAELEAENILKDLEKAGKKYPKNQ